MWIKHLNEKITIIVCLERFAIWLLGSLVSEKTKPPSKQRMMQIQLLTSHLQNTWQDEQEALSLATLPNRWQHKATPSDRPVLAEKRTCLKT